MFLEEEEKWITATLDGINFPKWLLMLSRKPFH